MHVRARVPSALGLVLVAAALQVGPATAAPDGKGLVISEVYGGGGNAGAPLTNDFVELYNPTADPVSVAGMSVQYRSSTGTSAQVTALTGSVPAGGHYLVAEAGGTTGAALPAADASGSIAMSASSGVVILAPTTAPVSTVGDLAGSPAVVDVVGFGTAATTFETSNTGSNLSNTTSASRSATGADSDRNATDFRSGTPSPQGTGSGGTPPGGGDAVDKTIAEIQGTGAASPLVGQTVHTTGVVTAVYPTGGFNGLYLQTAGTGSGADATPGASDAVFVFGAGSGASTAHLGDYLDVTGVVSEFGGLTEVTPAAGGVKPATVTAAPVTPLAIAYPTTAAGREAHEGELLAPTDTFTVTDTFSTNQYAEIGLATGT
ncbi:MAG: lamin tail domain-containing protein, partial [Marmoricola sp.]